MHIPKSGEFYKHFKDKLYQIVTIAEHSENAEKLVIYQALYGDFKVYARPLEMFLSEVDHEKYPDVKQKYRFEKVEFAGEMQIFVSAETVESEKAESTENDGEVQLKESTEKELLQDIVLNDSQKEEMNGSTSVMKESIADETDNIQPEAGLLEFLDEEDWDKKYNILVSLRDKMDDRLVDNLAVALDVVIPDGPVDKRYEQLKICVRTRQKYENQHLR